MTRTCTFQGKDCTQRAPWIYGPHAWVCGGCHPKGGKTKCYHRWEKKNEYHVCSICNGKVPTLNLRTQIERLMEIRKVSTWDDLYRSLHYEFQEADIDDMVVELLDDEFITEPEENQFHLATKE